MKTYLNLAIRVNIALFLASKLVGAFIVLIVSAFLSSFGLVDSGILIWWTGLAALIIILFIAGYWVFKLTYRNMKEAKKITLEKAIIYSVALNFIINFVYIMFLEEKDFVYLGVGAVFLVVPFYLAGKSVEKSFIKN